MGDIELPYTTHCPNAQPVELFIQKSKRFQLTLLYWNGSIPVSILIINMIVIHSIETDKTKPMCIETGLRTLNGWHADKMANGQC